MKKRLFVCLLAAGLCFAAGCALFPIPAPPREPAPQEPPQNPALEQLGLGELPEGALAVIVNSPSEEELKKVETYEIYTFDASDQSQLIVPVWQESRVEVAKVAYSTSQIFHKEESLTISETGDGKYALLVQAARPEGLPRLAFWITREELSGEYLLSYNGKDVAPHFEYIKVGDQINQDSLFLQGTPFFHENEASPLALAAPAEKV